MSKKKPIGIYDGYLKEIPSTDVLDATIASFTHEQGSPSATWVITHNLNTFPVVTVKDSAGSVVLGTTTYDSENQVTLTFTGTFGGTAYLKS
jgi:hypothetical protein